MQVVLIPGERIKLSPGFKTAIIELVVSQSID